VATSGDAFQYLEIDGRRYSHILDPRTGIGLTTPGSVTVIAPDGTAADALASAVSVLGPERGLKRIARKCRCEALILRRVQEPGGLPGQAESNSDEIKTYESAGFKKYEVPDNDTKDEVPEKDKKHEVPEKDMKE
jgi:thiamine biosynthesis lipoprotein